MAAGQMQSSFDVASDDGAHGNTCITIAAYCRSKGRRARHAILCQSRKAPKVHAFMKVGSDASMGQLPCGPYDLSCLVKSWLIMLRRFEPR